MRLSKDLVGKSVVTLSDGRIIGEVKDVYVTPNLSHMAGIHLGKKGVLRRKSLLVPADSVVVFGIDVILVKDSEALTDDRHLKDSAEWVRVDSLDGRKIDTPGGTSVGMVGDVVLDEAGKVIAFSLSKVFVEGPLSEKRFVYKNAIIDSGNEDGAMTIDLTVAERMQPEEPTTDMAEAEILDADESEKESSEE